MYRSKRFKALAAPLVLLAATSAAHAETSLDASFRFGIQFTDDDQDSADLGVFTDESKIRLNHSSQINDSLSAIAKLELEIEPDNITDNSSGFGRTREAWVGVKSSFGRITVGTQYTSFYATVSGVTDIALTASCLSQQRCDEDDNVLKYSGESGSIKYTSSARLAESDDGTDIADELELGASFGTGPISFGVATSFRASEGNQSSGFLIGGVASTSLDNGLELGLGLQVADSDFTGSGDTSTQVTFSGAYGSFYTVLNLADGLVDDAGSYGTVGYTHQLSDNALLYFEGLIFDGNDDLGTLFGLLAAFKYDFDIL